MATRPFFRVSAPKLAATLALGGAGLAAAHGLSGGVSVSTMPSGPRTVADVHRPPASFSDELQLPGGKRVRVPGLSQLREAGELVKTGAHGVVEYADDSRQHARIEINPAAVAPPAKDQLTAVTFNIEEGGKNLPAVLAYLKQTQPDVVFLQESSVDSARALAHELGMNAAYGSNWKVVLSRYPIVDARAQNYPVSTRERVSRAIQQHSCEALEVRGLLDATLQVGDRQVHAVDSHFSTSEEDWSAREFAALGAYERALAARHELAITGGDFNANLALAQPGAADPASVFVTPTDTLGEWTARYGGPGLAPGNLANPRTQAAAESFANSVEDAWKSPDAGVISGGKRVTAAQALARASEPGFAPHSDAGSKVLQQMDGNTFLGLHQRIDGLFGSPGMEPTSATVDQDVRASDHQPYEAVFALPPSTEG